MNNKLLPSFLFILTALLLFPSFLTGKGYKNGNTEEWENIPSPIKEWLDSELEKAPVKKTPDLDPLSFFDTIPARLVGYIRGHDPASGIESGLTYTVNQLTREPFPTVIRIHPDGRFEADLIMQHPIHAFFHLFQQVFPFYIEPGQTLVMLFDANDFQEEKNMQEKKLQKIIYRGPLAQINRELNLFYPEEYDSSNMSEKVTTQSPEYFKGIQTQLYERNRISLEQLIQEEKISEPAAHLLRLNERLEYSSVLLWYLSMRNYAFETDTTGNEFIHGPLPEGFLDFLYEIPFNDISLLATQSFGVFINRIEFSYPFHGWHTTALNYIYEQDTYKKSFFEYLKEEGVQLNDSQAEFVEWASRLNKDPFRTLQEFSLEELFKKVKTYLQLDKEYRTYSATWHEKYRLDINQTFAQQTKEWELIDYILNKDLQFQENNLIFEIIRLRSFNLSDTPLFMYHTREESQELLEALSAHLSHPFLKREAIRMFNQYTPAEAQTATELPEGKGKEVLTGIIKNHKGKILFIDFWATWCSPCVGNIHDHKKTREKYEENSDFEFIFITDESSPLASYEKFVEEQQLTHSYRLSSSEFHYLKEMLQFHGIPKYIVIDKEGRLLEDNFNMGHFEISARRIPGINLEE